MNRISVVIAGAALAASAVSSQARPMMGKAMSHPAAASADLKYLMENAQGSVYDFTTAEVAVQKAGSRAVQNYGLQLLDDHTRLNKMMFVLANKRGLTLPVTLAATDKIGLMRLMKPGGAAFDKAYLKEAIRINADDVKSAQKELGATKDAEIKRVVGEFLQTEQKHLQGAKTLLASMSKM